MNCQQKPPTDLEPAEVDVDHRLATAESLELMFEACRLNADDGPSASAKGGLRHFQHRPARRVFFC